MPGGRRAVISIFALLSLLLIGNSAHAQYQYAPPPPVKEIQIEKQVAKPIVTKGGVTTEEFVENLSPSDPRFSPDQEVKFRLVVRNTSGVKLFNVQVKDFVPEFLEPLEVPGSFDVSTRTISFGAGDFDPDQEKEFILRVKVVSQDRLPQDRGLFCVVNKARAEAEGVSAEDIAQLCIEKQVIGAAEVPAAGPEYGLALLGFSTLSLWVGVRLKKWR